MTITDRDLRSAYAKLRELTKYDAPQNANRTEIEAQAKVVDDFMRQNIKTKPPVSQLEVLAEMALAEGNVELFEKLGDWCNLAKAQNEDGLGPWKQSFKYLYYNLNYHYPNSVKLASRLASSKSYIKVLEMRIRTEINNEKQLDTLLRNLLVDLNAVQVALGAFLGLYPLILEIYKSKTYVL